jgi:hypothetical protein
VPDLDCTVFGTGDDDGKLGVVASKRNIAGVTFKGRDEGLGGVIPDLMKLMLGLHAFG